MPSQKVSSTIRLLSPSLSMLQEKILQIVCTRESVTYRTLVEDIHRDRITVLQSVNSLVKQNYIVKQKANPEHEKSKLFFKPTYSGKLHAVFKMKIGIEEILKTEKDEDICKYFEIIKDIADPLQRDMFIQPLRVLFTRPLSPAFYSKVTQQQVKKDDLKKGLREGILRSVESDNYDVKYLLNDRSIRSLKELLGSTDMRELKNSLIQIRNNLSKTIERLN